MSNVYGDSNFPIAGYGGDVGLVAHELGHNLGSPHTHCYSPPIDHCYNVEFGCYSGPVEPPADTGEIMSYCSPKELVFRERVGQTIRETIEYGCMAPKTPLCGDAIVDAGEECDDGDSDDGDCCSSTCTLLSNTSAGCDDGFFCTDDYACADATCYYQPHICDDGNGCTHEYCDDVSGSCQTSNRDGVDCDDGLYCTLNETCQGGACGGGQIRTCQDGDACTSDFCDEANDVCVNMVLPPSNTCDDAGSTQIAMQHTPSGDKITWKWGKGAAIDPTAFGNPRTDYTNPFALCFYDENDQLLTSLRAGVSNVLWYPPKNGMYKYKDSTKYPAPNYLTGMTLKPGEAEKGKLMAKGKRASLAFPSLPITGSSLRVQLRRGAGPECWQSLFVPPFDANLASEFKDKE